MSRHAKTARLAVLFGLLAFLCACGDSAPPEADRAVDQMTSAPVSKSAPGRAAPPPAASPQDLFWARLATLCGNAYAGYLTVGTEESDRRFGEADLVIHVSECSADEVRIPFHVGADRSRTFIVRRVGDTLTLHHRHLDENGDIAEPDAYGGATQNAGTPLRQEFIVDEATKTKLPATRYNVWAMEVAPGKLFAYELQRPEEERFFRVEFELNEPIDAPPPAWGDS